MASMNGRKAQEADLAEAEGSDGPTVTTGPYPTLEDRAAKGRCSFQNIEPMSDAPVG